MVVDLLCLLGMALSSSSIVSPPRLGRERHAERFFSLPLTLFQVQIMMMLQLLCHICLGRILGFSGQDATLPSSLSSLYLIISKRTTLFSSHHINITSYTRHDKQLADIHTDTYSMLFTHSLFNASLPRSNKSTTT